MFYLLNMDHKNYKVGIFIPCCVDQFAAGSGLKMVRLLESIGLQCYYPDELTCCGMELYNQGDREGAKQLGERLIEQYEDCSFIVSCGSACITYMQRHFGHLFHNTTLHNNYRQFTSRCFDLCDFLVNVVDFKPTGIQFPHKVALLDHCSTNRDYISQAHPDQPGLHDEPRTLLQVIEGLQLVEMAQSDVCCGYGGMFASNFTPISDSLAKRKIENAMAAGAEYIVSTEMSCLLHLQSYIDKNKLPLQCLHIIDLLENEEANS